MIVEREIQTQIDINNVISFYQNLDTNILGLLKLKFEKKCYHGLFIKNILRVIKHGEGVIHNQQSMVFAKMPVTFIANCLIYNTGDIINNCIVDKKMDNGCLICHSDNVSIFINKNNLLTGIDIGQIISIKVGKAAYDIGKSMISINAYPMIYDFNPKYYRINTKELTEQQRMIVKENLDRIGDLEEDIAKLRKTSENMYKYFHDLFYAYKSAPDIKQLKTISLFDEIDGWVCRDPRIDLVSPNLVIYEQIPQGVIVEVSTSRSALMTCIDDVINYLTMMKEYMEIYNTEVLIKSHKNYWLVWSRSKL